MLVCEYSEKEWRWYWYLYINLFDLDEIFGFFLICWKRIDGVVIGV